MIWYTVRPRPVKQNCPELKGNDREKPKKLPGDDGKFRGQDVPGYVSEAVKKAWTGPQKIPRGWAAAIKKSTKGTYTR